MMLELLEGTMLYAALAIFGLGLLWHLLIGAARKSPYSRPDNKANERAAGMHPLDLLLFFGGILTLLLGAPHVEFIHSKLPELSLPVLPHWGFVVAAECAFAGFLLLWLRRVLHPALKAQGSCCERFAWLLLFLTMLSGCAALLQGSEELRYAHIITLELFLVWAPFSGWMPSLGRLFQRRVRMPVPEIN